MPPPHIKPNLKCMTTPAVTPIPEPVVTAKPLPTPLPYHTPMAKPLHAFLLAQKKGGSAEAAAAAAIKAVASNGAVGVKRRWSTSA